MNGIRRTLVRGRQSVKQTYWTLRKSLLLFVLLSLTLQPAHSESGKLVNPRSSGIAITDPSERILDLNFSTEYGIDNYDVSQDAVRPLYFNLVAPAGRARGNTRYRYTADIGTNFATWLDRRVPSGTEDPNDRSLAVKITASVDENVKDKILFSVVSHDGENHLSIVEPGNERYLSFNFMLDPDYQLPHNWALHLQAWQCCGGHPPFSIRVKPGRNVNGPIELEFMTSNDELESQSHDQFQSIYQMELVRGEWHNMVLGLQPKPIGSLTPGKIEMWFDGQNKLAWSGYWGYAPATRSYATKGLVRNNIGIELGVYRRRQTTTQTILFDNIRFGTTLKSVADFTIH